MPKMQMLLELPYVDNRDQVEHIVDALKNAGWLTYTQAPIVENAIAARLPGALKLEARTPKSVIYITIGMDHLRVNNRAKVLTGLQHFTD